MTTQGERWESALSDIRALGVQVMANVDSCCVGCIPEDALPEFDGSAPYILWLDSQGRGIAFNAKGEFCPQRDYGNTKKHIRYKGADERSGVRYLNHGNVNTAAVCAALRGHGFKVVAPRSKSQAIGIYFTEDLS